MLASRERGIHSGGTRAWQSQNQDFHRLRSRNYWLALDIEFFVAVHYAIWSRTLAPWRYPSTSKNRDEVKQASQIPCTFIAASTPLRIRRNSLTPPDLHIRQLIFHVSDHPIVHVLVQGLRIPRCQSKQRFDVNVHIEKREGRLRSSNSSETRRVRCFRRRSVRGRLQAESLVACAKCILTET